MSKRLWLAGMAVVLMASAFPAWKLYQRHIVQSKPYRIGFDQDPPQQFRGPDGRPTGMVVGLVAEAARRRGIALEWIDCSALGSEAALRSGKVDLWPLMTITPERRKVLHFSTPYLDTVLAFFVLPERGIHSFTALSHERIGIRNLPINPRLLHGYLPDAVPVPHSNSAEVIGSVCRGDVVAGMLDQDDILQELMAGRGVCQGHRMELVPVPGPRLSFGVGARKESAAAADAIRDEIDDLYINGTVDEMFTNWGYLAGRRSGTVELLLEARRSEAEVKVVATLLAALLLLAVWQTFRFRRQTERAQQAEAALRESYAELSEAQRLAELGGWSWDSRSGETRWSEQKYRMFGIDPSQPPVPLDEQTCFFTQDSLDRLKAAVADSMGSGEGYRIELEAAGPDGSARSITARGEAVRDGKGNIVGMRGTVQDVTERRKMQSKLESTENSLHMAMDAAELGTFEWDIRAGKIAPTSQTERIFGFAPGEWTGDYSAARTFTHPDDLERLDKASRAALAARGTFSEEFRIIRRDGRTRWILCRGAFEFSEAGEPVRMHGVVMDITDRRHLEAQLIQAQKMESIGRLAGGVAHDFNNLLTVINGYSELILSDPAAGEASIGPAKQILLAGNRAAALTQQLLLFSRQQPVQAQLIDLNALIAESKDLLQRLVGYDIRISTAAGTDPAPIRADASQIHQILMNLAVNARDAMPGGGDLRIETALFEAGPDIYRDRSSAEARTIEPGYYLVLTVSDTGTGIDEETQRHIFEPFFTTKPQGKGTGLGLATVYGIVKQNRGWIEIASKLGKGSTFRIFLPRAEAERAADPPTPRTAPVAPSDSGPKTILVVEDQDGLLKLVAGVLAKAGYRVLSASDGESALAMAAIHDGTIDMVLSDVIMPGMNGFGVVERLRMVRPSIRIVLMSGYTEEAVAQRGAIQPGAVYIAKPFTPVSLVARVREVLDRPT
jgi:PAS domain S-box-containing protein